MTVRRGRHSANVNLRAEVVPQRAIDKAVEFHDLIWEIGGNQVLRLYATAISHIFRDRAMGSQNHNLQPRERSRIRREHIEIVAAINAGDVALARELAQAHMRTEVQVVHRLNPALLDEIVDWR